MVNFNLLITQFTESLSVPCKYNRYENISFLVYFQGHCSDASLAPDPGGTKPETTFPTPEVNASDDGDNNGSGKDDLKIHLVEPKQTWLQNGDGYLWLDHESLPNSSTAFKLRFSQMTNGYLRELTILECDYKTLCNMDWIKSVEVKSEAELATLLGHLYIAAEQGVGRMSLDSLNLQVVRKVAHRTKNSAKTDLAVNSVDNDKSQQQKNSTLSRITKVLKHQIPRPGKLQSEMIRFR